MKNFAIIGYAARFPEASDLSDIYSNFTHGRDSVRKVSASRIRATGVESLEYQDFAYLDHVDRFDHNFFDISLGEAEHMDPHQRLILEVAYHACESAGIPTEKLNNQRVSVYCSDTDQRYYQLIKTEHPAVLLGNLNATTAGRISRFFNLRGNAVMIDTACSSSLVALHMACNDLAVGESNMALVAGANIILFPNLADASDETGIDSPDGRAKSFSAAANGTGNGEAVVCIVVKRLEDAVRDKDLIHAVIKGIAVNQDAKLSSNLSAPSSIAQAEVISECLQKAAIPAEAVTYIEAHGTGTPLGDPIEIEGITSAFKTATDRKQFCAISALKSNIGHTDTVAGLAGLIKVLLALKHQQLFPSLHFEEPNPFISFLTSPVYVNTILRPWSGHPEHGRVAGLSSFGISGTNCHAIIQELRSTKKAHRENTRALLFALSAKSPGSFHANAVTLCDYLKEPQQLEDVSFTLNVCRSHYRHRGYVIARTPEELKQRLQSIGVKQCEKSNSPTSVWCFLPDINDLSPDKILDYFKNVPVLHDDLRQFTEGASKGKFSAGVCFQLAMLHVLERLNIPINQIVSDGRGKIAAKSIREKTALEEVLVAAEAPVDIANDLHERLTKFVSAKLKPGDVVLTLGSHSNADHILHELAGRHGFNVLHAMQGDCLLDFIGSAYQIGLNVQFDALYQINDVSKVTLPAYKFERTRCWTEREISPVVKGWFYDLAWVETNHLRESNTRIGNVLFVCSEETGQTYLAGLRKNGDKALAVVLSDKFEIKSPDVILIDPENSLHFEKLRQHLDTCGYAFETLIDLMTNNAAAIDDVSLMGNVLHRQGTARLNVLKEFLPGLSERNGRVAFVCFDAHDIVDGDTISPVAPAIFAMYKAVLSEYPQMSIHAIDVDSTGQSTATIADIIIREITNAEYNSFHGYRRGVRYIQEFRRLDVPNDMRQVPWVEKGTYIITGGAFGIGNEVAKEVARTQGTVIVVGRQELPAKSEWKDRLLRKKGSDAELNRIRNLLEIELEGASVEYHQADVGDEHSFGVVLERVARRHPRIDGVLHIAGATGPRVPLTQLSQKDFVATLRPKVQGATVVGEFARKLGIPQVVFFSSFNTTLPQGNSVDYTVANAFLDVYVKMISSGKLKATAICWGAWGEVGTSAEFARAGKNVESMLEAWPVALGIDALNIAVSMMRTNVIVAKLNTTLFTDFPFFKNASSLHATPPGLASAETGKVEDDQRERNSAADIVSTLQSIWVEVLRKKNISSTDNFFQLGGHSLLAARILNLFAKQTGITVTFRDLVRFPTIRELAGHLEKQTDVAPTSMFEIPLQPIGPQYVASPAQRRLWTAHHIEKNNYHYNLVKCLRIKGSVNVTTLVEAVKRLFDRHEVLRTTFVFEHGSLYQTITPTESFSYPISVQHFGNDRNFEDAVRFLLANDLMNPFDLERGPLCSFKIFEIASGDVILSYSFHHIVSDGWSAIILPQDLLKIYQGLIVGGQPLKPLRIQYKDFSCWLADEMNNPALQKQRGYWLAQLQGNLIPVRIPGSLREPESRTFHAGQCVTEIDELTRFGLQQWCTANDVTIFSALVTMINWLLSHYTQTTQIILGIPMSGRSHADLDNQIGFYVNMLPLRSTLRYNQDFSSACKTAHETIQEAFNNQLYPFDLLTDQLSIEGGDISSLFYVTVTQNLDMDEPLAQSEFGIEEFELDQKIIANKINFDVSSSGRGINVDYAAEIFPLSMMQLLSLRLGVLIKIVTGSPEITMEAALARMDSTVLHTVTASEINLDLTF